METSSIVKRKKILFGCGVLLLFFTSMNKVLIPGAVFDPLQHDFGLDAATMAAMGSWNMMAYAVSQFTFGMLADRLGGTRILLLGGGAYCIGMLAFPYCPCPQLLLPLRALAGFGAGIVFLGLAKLMADLFMERFAYVLGYSLVVGYLGTVAGQAPAVWLVGAAGWRPAVLGISVVAAAAYLGILLSARGTFDSAAGDDGPRFIPALKIMARWEMIRLGLASAITIGCYNALLNVMGRKGLEDLGARGQAWPTLFMTCLALFVVGLNMLGGNFSKWFSGRYNLAMKLLTGLTLAGAALGWCAIQYGWGGAALAASYIVLAIPAGFFPLFCSAGKSTVPPQCTALVFSIVNFWAAFLIAVACGLAGRAMKLYEREAVQAGDVLVYTPDAYQAVFVVFIALGAIAFAATIGLLRRKRADA